MNVEGSIAAVVAQFPEVEPAAQIESLGNAGGFSGARFWRFSARGRLWCLRRWPAEHPSPRRLCFIHAVLRMAARNGCHFVPAPQTTHEGATFVQYAGHLWEVTPWMPGRADFHDNPTQARLQAACRAVAQFHQAVAAFDLQRFDEELPARGDAGELRPAPLPTFDARRLAGDTESPGPSAGRTADEPLASREATGRLGRAPGVVARLREVQGWLDGEFDLLRRSIDPRRFPQLAEAAQEIVALAARAAPRLYDELRAVVDLTVGLQPCIRDVWHDHVLWTGDEVTGIVDYGALRVDSVAADLARLLGSLVEDDRHLWNIGLAAYQSLRPLTAQECVLLSAYDRANVILSGLHWLQWVFCRGCTFEERGPVLRRVETHLRRLRRLV
jgi:Ser/Thr protein kinase RdoA (MazF antagonist)